MDLVKIVTHYGEIDDEVTKVGRHPLNHYSTYDISFLFSESGLLLVMKTKMFPIEGSNQSGKGFRKLCGLDKVLPVSKDSVSPSLKRQQD